MKTQGWKIPYSRPAYPAELKQADCGPLLSAVLALRGCDTVAKARELLDGGDPQALHDPMQMQGMAQAVRRLRRAIEQKEAVAVYGDYDVDGITSTCLVTDYLRSKGLHCVGYIPDRNEEGYGLNCAALDSLRDEGITLLTTVDCGITAVEEAEHTKAIGMDMIVTDHHECKPDALPDAVYATDPATHRITFCNAVFRELPGAPSEPVGSDLRTSMPAAFVRAATEVWEDLLLRRVRTDRYFRLPGDRRVWRLSYNALLDDAGEISDLVGHVADVSFFFRTAPSLAATLLPNPSQPENQP